MGATLVTPKTTSGGEIIRELVNASDGAGLHFDGSAGYIDIASPPDLGTKFSFEFVFKATTWTSGDYKFLVDFRSGSGRFIIGTSNAGNNLKIFDNSSYKDTGVVIFDDLDVHHVVVTVDGTSALVYDNGNQVGSATISASHNIHTATDACIASNVYFASANCVNGTYYRCRFYNKTLTSAEVQTAYERADVDYADQYGSQTAILESDFSSGTSGFTGAGITVAGNIDSIGGQNDTLRSTIDSSTGNHQTIRGISGTNGKRYRATGKVYIPSANALVDKVVVNNQGGLTNVIATITATDTWTDFEAEFIREYPEIRFRAYDGTANSFAGNGSDVFYIKDIKIVPAGCVSDYDLAFANPTQSRMVQDRAGAADGTASTSGVTQVQPIIQGNLTSLAVGSAGLPAGVPADNHVFIGDTTTSPLAGADDLVIARGSNDAGITIKTADQSTGQICFADGNADSNAGYRGYIGYKHGTGEALNLGSGGSTRLTIDSTGAVSIPSAAGTQVALTVKGGNNLVDNTALSILNQAGDTGTRISNNGQLFTSTLATFSNGIAFQSATTGSGTGTGYTLENYEYGTFTMELSGTTATIPSGNEIARYYRVGNLVWISWYSGPMTLASSSGAAQLTGLPFNVANNNANYSVFSYTHGNAVDGNSHGGYFIVDTTRKRFIDAAGTGASTYVDGSSKYIMVTGVYETDDA